MHYQIPERTKRRAFTVSKNSWIKNVSKETDELACTELQKSNRQLSAHDFFKAWSLLLRPEIIGIFIWSKFQLISVRIVLKQLDYSLLFSTRLIQPHPYHLIEISSSQSNCYNFIVIINIIVDIYSMLNNIIFNYWLLHVSWGTTVPKMLLLGADAFTVLGNWRFFLWSLNIISSNHHVLNNFLLGSLWEGCPLNMKGLQLWCCFHWNMKCLIRLSGSK